MILQRSSHPILRLQLIYYFIAKDLDELITGKVTQLSNDRKIKTEHGQNSLPQSLFVVIE